MHIRPHERLIAWQEAYKLSVSVHRLTSTFPQHELRGLTSQIRRAANSVHLNIAEGNRKTSSKEKRKFFQIALCSLEELHSGLRFSCEVDYINRQEFMKADDHINRVSFLLNRLRAAFA
ncbi:MAG: four helix bundle protein [Candidatus Peribacteraceae bacterium]|nr:four helix bundle protein [Candidatus Peribacteraceae bacterium]